MIRVLAALLLSLTFFAEDANAYELTAKPDEKCQDLKNTRLASKGQPFERSGNKYEWSVCYDFYVPAGSLGVVTVHPNNPNWDVDVLITDYKTGKTLAGTKGAGWKEWEIFGDASEGRWYNIVVSPHSHSSGVADIYIHRVNLSDVMFKTITAFGAQVVVEELLCNLISGEGCSTLSDGDRDMMERAFTAGMASLDGVDVGRVSRSVIVNEVVSYIRHEAGLPRRVGTAASILANTFLDDALRHY